MLRTGNKKISLAAYMNFLSIVGAGDVTWNQVVDAGYDTVDKINAMTIEELSNVGSGEGHRVGEKTAQKIWDCLHSERVQELMKFFDLWIDKGPPMEDIAKAFERVETSSGYLPNRIGFIVPKDENLVDFLKRTDKPIEEESELKMDLRGKKVLFTGTGPFSRSTLTAVLKRNGAVVQDNIRKDTEVLILADLNSDSNKVKKARKWGIKMVTYEDVFKG